MHNKNTSVPPCTGITQITTKEVHNLEQIEEQTPCPDYNYSGQEYHTPEQETVPTHPVENNDEEGGISEKNRQASQLVQDKEAQVAHPDGSKKDQEEEDDEEEDHEENGGNRKADKENNEEDDEEDKQTSQLVQNKEAQVAHPADDDGDEKEDDKEEDNKGANPIYKTNRYYILTLLNLTKKALALISQWIQKSLQHKKKKVPKEEEMKLMSRFMQKLDSYHNLPASIIHSTKIKKVLSHILKLNSIPKDKEYNFCGCTLNILTKFTAITRQKNNEDLDLCHIETNKEHSLPNQGDSCQMDKDVCINADKDHTLPHEDGFKLRDENGDKDGYCTSSNPNESQLRETENKDECYITFNTDDSQLENENAHTNTNKDCTLPHESEFKLRDENRDKDEHHTPSNSDKSQLREGENENDHHTTSNADDSQLEDENVHTDIDKDHLDLNQHRLDGHQTKVHTNLSFNYTPDEPAK
ncbi:hypothetical protein FQN52_005855 [Onygenales sp. PD_12]|nr:hypothetical protein FQN52_005855 [Onygenales sp. PD_12]